MSKKNKVTIVIVAASILLVAGIAYVLSSTIGGDDKTSSDTESLPQGTHSSAIPITKREEQDTNASTSKSETGSSSATPFYSLESTEATTSEETSTSEDIPITAEQSSEAASPPQTTIAQTTSQPPIETTLQSPSMETTVPETESTAPTTPFYDDAYKLPETGAKAAYEDGYAGIYVYEGAEHWIRPFPDAEPDIEGSTNYSVTFVGKEVKDRDLEYSITFRIVYEPVLGHGPEDFPDYPNNYQEAYEKAGFKTMRMGMYKPQFLEKFFGAYRDSIGFKMEFGACMTNYLSDKEEIIRQAYYSVYQNSDVVFEVLTYIRADRHTMLMLKNGVYPFESSDDLLYHIFMAANEAYPEVEYPVGRYFLTDYWYRGRKEKLAP